MLRNYKTLNVRELNRYENNSRTHSPEQIQKVANSIKHFGFTNPLLIDENNNIIAGHCRLDAAISLGYEHVPVLVIDGLTEEQYKALVIADNKLALDAGWNDDILRSELQALHDCDFDISLTGFDVDYLETPDFEASSLIEQGDLTVLDEKKCPNCGHNLR